jgi:hypothetical protein
VKKSHIKHYKQLAGLSFESLDEDAIASSVDTGDPKTRRKIWSTYQHMIMITGIICCRHSAICVEMSRS